MKRRSTAISSVALLLLQYLTKQWNSRLRSSWSEHDLTALRAVPFVPAVSLAEGLDVNGRDTARVLCLCAQQLPDAPNVGAVRRLLDEERSERANASKHSRQQQLGSGGRKKGWKGGGGTKNEKQTRGIGWVLP